MLIVCNTINQKLFLKIQILQIFSLMLSHGYRQVQTGECVSSPRTLQWMSRSPFKDFEIKYWKRKLGGRHLSINLFFYIRRRPYVSFLIYMSFFSSERKKMCYDGVFLSFHLENYVLFINWYTFIGSKRKL